MGPIHGTFDSSPKRSPIAPGSVGAFVPAVLALTGSGGLPQFSFCFIPLGRVHLSHVGLSIAWRENAFAHVSISFVTYLFPELQPISSNVNISGGITNGTGGS